MQSWIIGTTVVLLLVLVRESNIAPRLSEILLWPGVSLAGAAGYSTRDRGIGLLIFSNVMFYGFVAFLVMRLIRIVFFDEQ